MSRKHDKELTKLLIERVKFNNKTRRLEFDGIYAKVAINIGWKGTQVVIPYSHLVWLTMYGKWPDEGMVLDHINDDSTDDSPGNLQEITQIENQKKRRGRLVYRSYGKGKYGYGIHIHNDKRDGRFYVTRQLSRGHGLGDLKSVKKGIGGFSTLREAKTRVKKLIVEIEKYGSTYMPE